MGKANKSITLLFDEATFHEAKCFYNDIGAIKEAPTPYMDFFAVSLDTTISVYSKIHNGFRKCLIQGENAESEAAIWIAKGAIPEEKSEKKEASLRNYYPQIGSDEVGTGDYFGPVIVVAAYVKKEDLPLLKELGITDSKKMNDPYILSIGQKLISTFPYSQLCLDNEKYNEVREKGINLNAMKAKMHNRALGNLKKKYPSSKVYIDQFAEEGLYYSYLKGEEDVVRDIVFSTKGETHFPSVALASVIARYSFLRHMEELSKSLGKEIPFGASGEVTEFARQIYKEKGLEELDKISKANFANRKKVIED